MKSNVTNFNIHSRQRGAVLFVALVLLLVLTIIAIAGMQTTTLQETMAGNMRDKNLAFQAAEAALRDCEATLEQVVLPGISAANGFYRSTDFSSGSMDPVWETVDWEDGSREYGADGTQELTRVAADPRCIIVELPPVKLLGGSLASDTPANDTIYQVTARAVGGSANTTIMLQTTFKR